MSILLKTSNDKLNGHLWSGFALGLLASIPIIAYSAYNQEPATHCLG